MSTISVHDSVRIPSFHVPGQIYHEGMPNFVDPADLLLLDQDQILTDMMRKTGGMTGDRNQTPGVFARMISYGHMPINDMQAAWRNGLTGAAETSIRAFTDLINVGLRPAESVIDSWIQGYGGKPPHDIPPMIRREYDYEKALFRARESQFHSVLEHPSDAMHDWMERLSLTSGILEQALINPYAIDSDPYPFIKSDELLRMRELGLFALKIPKEYGGLDLNQREYDRVLRAVIRSMSGTMGGIVSAHSTIGSAPLVHYGTDAQRRFYLPEIAKGLSLCAFGLTERGSGTDAIDGASTTAKRDGDNYVMNGSKIFITNTQRAGVMFVLAKLVDGAGESKPTVFIVDLPFRITDSVDLMNAKRKTLAKGELGELSEAESKALAEANLSESEKRALNQEGAIIISNPLDLMMIRGSNQAYIEFKDFKLPVVKDINGTKVESILGGQEGIGAGAKQIFNSLNKGRAGFGSFCAEGATAAFEAAVIEAVQRSRFPLYGGRLADLPKVKEYISKMAVKVAALNAVSELTTRLIDTYPNMNIIAESAAIKAYATEEAWEIIPTVARMFGGMGTMKGSPIELMLRDMWIPLIVEGVNEALKQHLVLVSSKPAMRAQKALGLKMEGIKEAWNVLAGRFKYEKGDLGLSDAWWIQRQTKKVSWDALMLGKKYGNKTALHQNEILDIADRAIDLYVATAVLIKLQDLQKPETLKEKAEKRALEQFITNMSAGKGNEKYPPEIANLYIDNAMVEVGQLRYQNGVLIQEQLRKEATTPELVKATV